MSWDSISFTKSPMFISKLNTASAALAGKASVLNAVPGTLANTPTIDTHNPSATFDLPVFGDTDLHQITTASYRCVFVHPWCEGIGQGVGHFRYLAPANAVESAAKKFIDSNDRLKVTTTMDVLALLITGDSAADMHEKLTAFLSAFNHPEILMCANRCKSLAVLEKAKEVLPDAALNASWKINTVAASGSVRNYVAAIGNALSFVDGYNCDSQSAEDEIAKVAEKKALRINDSLNRATAETNKLTGAVGKKLFLSNKSPAAVKRELINSGLGYDAPLSVCLVLAGDVGSLEHIRGLF